MKIRIPFEQHNIMIDNSYQNLNHIKLTKIQSNSFSSLNSSMVGEEDIGRKRCSYRYKDSTQASICTITCEFSSDLPSSKLRADDLKKTCNYRTISTHQKSNGFHGPHQKQFDDYGDYMRAISQLQDNSRDSSFKITEEIPQSYSFSIKSQKVMQQDLEVEEQTHPIPPISKKKKISKTKEKRQQMMNDTHVQQLNNEYKQIKDQNSLKNIKEAFTRHINSNLSDQLKDIYVQRMGGSLQFGQIKKKINFSLKENSTNNKCIKFMCKSNQVSPVFLYFLEHIEEFWLSESKVQNKDACKSIVSFLIKIIKNVQFIDLIEHYHTKI